MKHDAERKTDRQTVCVCVLFSCKDEWNYVICRKVMELEILLRKNVQAQEAKQYRFSLPRLNFKMRWKA